MSPLEPQMSPVIGVVAQLDGTMIDRPVVEAAEPIFRMTTDSVVTESPLSMT